jgi:membrane protein DedA with SNARE-associated domain
MALEEVIVIIFREYTPILALLAGLMFGDMLMLLGFLAGVGKANFFMIILFGFLGGLIHDLAFYLIANSRAIHFIKRKFRLSKRKNKIAQIIEKMGSGHYFLPILMAKFVYGVRDAVILYVAHNNKNLKKYLLVVSGADLIWLITITSLGWLAGRGFTSLVTLFKGFEKWLFILLVAALILYFLNRFIISFLLKHGRRYAKEILNV